MWLITGPFDTEQQIDDIPNKTKLLKPATTHTIGRQKESALRINHKKVSRNNGELVVGTQSEEDVTNPAALPSLTFRNTRDVGIRVTRDDKSFVILAKSDRGLESGDLIRLAAEISFTVSWRPVVCFIPEDSSTLELDRKTCADLGIKLVTKHTRDVTHHLVSAITSPLPPSILLSLLNQAAIVTPQWLISLLSSANSFYQTYNPPLETDYIPSISPELSLFHQDSTLLLPNKNRKGLFANLSFVLAVVGSGIGSETKAVADVVVRGGGERNLVDIEKEVAGDASKNSWDNLLKKARSKSSLVLVGEDKRMRERGIPRDIKKTWEGMVEKAGIAGLRIIHPSLVSEAILKADVSLLDCTASAEKHKQPETAQIPLDVPTEPENGSMEKGPSQQMESSSSRPVRRLARRAAAKPAIDDVPPPPPVDVQEVSTLAAGTKSKEIDSEIEDSAPKKKVLKRRAKTTGLVNALLGLDDPSINEQSSSQAARNEEPVSELSGAVTINVPVPPSPGGDLPASQLRRPLKRRARGNSQARLPVYPGTADEDQTGTSQLNKFKTLFEESGRGELDSLSTEDGLGAQMSQPLKALREEEEETQSQPQSGGEPRRLVRKRKLPSIEEMEEDSQDVEMRESQSDPRKKRAVEGANAIEPLQGLREENNAEPSNSKSDPNPPSSDVKTKAKGAEPGKPDVDISFLKAVATLKRGKRTEDDFDREFNQLRISRPKMAVERSKENQAPWAWEGLDNDNFERDIGIRGNFMQIVEIDVWRDQQPAQRYRGDRMDWEGRQNFKKFKKKLYNAEREVIALEPVGSHVEDPGIDYRPPARPVKRPIPALRVLVEDNDEHQEEGHPVLTSKNRLVSTRPRAPPPPRPKNKPSSSNRKKAVVESDFDDEETQGARTLRGRPLRSTATHLVASSSKKDADPLFIEDSEDEIENVALPKRVLGSTQGQSQSQDMMDIEETLKSDPKGASQTQTQTRGLKRKAPPGPVAAVEDDEDEVGTFGGFSRRSATKRRR